jgi:PAS domain S-box-containing protein
VHVNRPDQQITATAARERVTVRLPVTLWHAMLASQAQASEHPLPWAALLSFLAIGLKAAANAAAGTDVGFLPYVVAVGLAAWFGGMQSGLGATLFCLAGEALVFVVPIGHPATRNPVAILQAGLFVVSGVLISALSSALGAARRDSDRLRGRAEGLQRLALELSRVESFDETAVKIVGVTESIFGASAGVVSIHRPETNTIEATSRGNLPAPLTEILRVVHVDGSLPPAVAFRSGRPILLESSGSVREAFPSQLHSALTEVRALACVPLILGEHPIGVLTLAFSERSHFTRDDLQYLTNITDASAQAFARAVLFEDRKRSELRLGLLVQASEVLAGGFDYQAALPQLARLLTEEFADWALIEWSEPGGTYRAAARRDEQGSAGPESVSRVDRLEPPRRAMLIDSLEVALEPAAASLLARFGARSGVLAPVPVEGARGSTGVLAFGAAEEHRFAPADAVFASDLGRRIGVAVQVGSLLREATQFTATVDASLDAVILIDPETLRILYANDGALAQLGYTRAELIDMSALAIKPKFDEASYRELLAPLVAGRRAARTYPTTHRRKDGVDIPVEAFMQCVTLPDGEQRIIVSARDISERIEVQSRLYRLATSERARSAELRAIIESMREAVLVYNDAGDIVLTNQALLELLGEPIARYEDLARLLGAFEGQLPELAKASEPVEIRTEQPLRWLEVTAYRAVPSGEGDTSGSTVMLLRDVTEQRQAQLAQEAFMGILSHELRTPVTTIFGVTKILRRRRPEASAEVEDLLGDVEAESERLYRLVEDLLVLSRAQAGRISLEPEPVLLQHVVRTTLESERRTSAGVTFVEHVARDLPPIAGDRTYVEQIVRNLVGNAVKYGPDGGAQVVVEAEMAGDQVLLRVLDQGPGLSEEDPQQLFELFYRSPSTARSRPGAGIGLYVCRILIEAMGGRIWARTRPEGGSEFGVSLPVFEEQIRETGRAAATVG